jgi:hypothetical protein
MDGKSVQSNTYVFFYSRNTYVVTEKFMYKCLNAKNCEGSFPFFGVETTHYIVIQLLSMVRHHAIQQI